MSSTRVSVPRTVIGLLPSNSAANEWCACGAAPADSVATSAANPYVLSLMAASLLARCAS